LISTRKDTVLTFGAGFLQTLITKRRNDVDPAMQSVR